MAGVGISPVRCDDRWKSIADENLRPTTTLLRDFWVILKIQIREEFKEVDTNDDHSFITSTWLKIQLKIKQALLEIFPENA